jgi:restriction system protein
MSMFGGTGGYFWLDSWLLANIVQLGTQRFCKRFLNRTNDPCGRQGRGDFRFELRIGGSDG